MGAVTPIRDAAAYILAGGKSSRMGEDKAQLKLHGKALLQIAIEKTQGVVSRVEIVGPRDRFGVDAVEDIFPQCGPLGGIHAALMHSRSDLNLILAVDLPFIDAQFLRFLLEEAGASSAIVTVARTRDGFQPLCGVYHKTFAEAAEKALRERRYKIDALFPLVKTRIIEASVLHRFAFDTAMFQNLNTRAEYERAKARPHD